jgi:uncharacterized membrane protein (UPF0127 family)
MPSFLSPLLTSPKPRFVLRNARTGALLATRLEAALESRTRNRGLLGRDGLDPDHALVLAPCNSVHTFFMRFPIDVIFVNRDGTVRKITADLGPWRMAASLRAFAVVETAAGVVSQSGTRAGDPLVVAEFVLGSPGSVGLQASAVASGFPSVRL